MKNIRIRTGLIFLAVDAIFWIFIVTSCFLDPVECADSVFLEYIFFLPVSHWMSTGAMPVLQFIPESVYIAIIGGAQHFVFGYIFGWIIQKFKKN